MNRKIGLPGVIIMSWLVLSSISWAAGGSDDAAVPFQPTDESLKQYKCPDWFRDAKLAVFRQSAAVSR